MLQAFLTSIHNLEYSLASDQRMTFCFHEQEFYTQNGK